MSEPQRRVSEPAEEGAGAESAATRLHPTSMAQRLGPIHRLLSKWAFSFVRVEPKAVASVRALGERGAVVYVMRYRSMADTLLMNALFLRERLPLPRFLNGLPIGWIRSLRWITGRGLDRLREISGAGRRTGRQLSERKAVAELVRAGQPILLFLRARSPGLSGLFGSRRAVDLGRIADPYLRDVLRVARSGEREVFVVPLALFRGCGYRRRGTRLSTVVYSVHDSPSEPKKLLTFLLNRRDLSLTIGEEIPLRSFLEKYGRDGEERMTRRLIRALRLFLYREERVVWGPPLLAKQRVGEIVLGSREARAVIERIARERRVPVRKIEREAWSYFNEMASNFNGIYFAIIAFAFRRIWKRIFRGVEVCGLDRVAQRIREHPVVLVPCHRSHFDYLILSYIFHSHFLSPPHIAAGINMSFFPMGMLFRGAGAFFIRRTFEGNELYKTVFRQYLTYLIREGYTQEFFIEGGRSRTGKILTPKLGMLSAIVNAFVQGIRRDLCLVPVSISYERLVEEEAYKRELMGAEKERESFGALLRARSVLQTNYGTAYVSFGEPISLNTALGPLNERFREAPEDPEVAEEQRRFTLKLGFRLLAEVNAASVVSAPSIAATVLLSNSHPAIRVQDFLRRAQLLLDHAEREGASFTRSLAQDRVAFRETLAFLENSGLVKAFADGDGGILHVPDEKRINLDFYKNNSLHLFVLPALVSASLLGGVTFQRMKEDLWWWLDLFRNEFVLPERERLAAQIGDLLDWMRSIGVVSDGEADLAHPWIRTTAPILQDFREAYWVAAKTLCRLGEEGSSAKSLLAEMSRLYRMNLLLGVLRKPEGNTTVTLQNAMRRLQELGFLTFETRGRSGRWVLRGPTHDRLPEVERRLLTSVTMLTP